ncbi:MAG: beta-ketoacyl-[acyl-carrier-protein] synthase II [Armatimonadetes bacterium CG_4_10_14_0_8_um_filter_66_14]|nr:beta-ketoacyl-ACP synthase II [Armatimonadota bacterium]OIP05255.1 MAG: beta-ketoacyl-[acyl-carrier-protein] synthase II [Armatimonadetes bacterium CG2_30_66_41]PIU93906.1 MAG: beta-ketoacyl-[acyl-carrier-protein] synthase II [Armatimonadetes bacterium CG06_land_8_20_14_3_00_66_21]PIX46929.1 MAG: beta-ketoacyl-[acyl-carrier-protein] synthase II [Armatimonadetes bacterium CG_4_8_14_3_um_filter_66_20]PIZ32958.1 MAG: beta-ketoacyl-[acyl-carrier-protein] synthase II [Armatimonadetes bacterium CG
MEQVAITGMGCVSPLGLNVEDYWQALCAGTSGAGPITQFDPTDYPTRIAGEVKGFDPADFMDRKVGRRLDRFIQFAVASSGMALDDARFPLNESTRDGVAVIIGSGIGGIKTFEHEHGVLLEKGPTRVSPFLVPMMIGDMAAGQVSIVFGARGANIGVVTACASAGHAIGTAAMYIQSGRALAALAGGTEAAIAGTAVAGFCNMKALTRRNDEPAKASRPFDAERDGFLMAEGAGIVMLEALSHAQARGARIYGLLAGYGATGDAHHIAAMSPDAEGAIRAIREALRTAGLQPEDVDYVNAHGTSTELNDSSETAALKAVFGERAKSIPVSSTKSMTGHLLGASGAVELIATLKAIEKGVLPPTINLEHPDPLCDLDYVPDLGRRAEIRAALSNSFGFGGHNAVLAVTRPPA